MLLGALVRGRARGAVGESAEWMLAVRIARWLRRWITDSSGDEQVRQIGTRRALLDTRATIVTARASVTVGMHALSRSS